MKRYIDRRFGARQVRYPRRGARTKRAPGKPAPIHRMKTRQMRPRREALR